MILTLAIAITIDLAQQQPGEETNHFVNPGSKGSDAFEVDLPTDWRVHPAEHGFPSVPWVFVNSKSSILKIQYFKQTSRERLDLINQTIVGMRSQEGRHSLGDPPSCLIVYKAFNCLGMKGAMQHLEYKGPFTKDDDIHSLMTSYLEKAGETLSLDFVAYSVDPFDEPQLMAVLKSVKLSKPKR